MCSPCCGCAERPLLDVTGVSDGDVASLCQYLRTEWGPNGVRLPRAGDILTFNYDNYLVPEEGSATFDNRETQARVPHDRLQVARNNLPGFAAIERAALAHVMKMTGEYDLEIADAHLLKQPGSEFGPHRDVHTKGLRYSLVVKLTKDSHHAIHIGASSRMRVLEGGSHIPIKYGAQAGACALFRSQWEHTSMETPPALCAEGPIMKASCQVSNKVPEHVSSGYLLRARNL